MNLNGIDRLVIYGHGEKLFEKNRNLMEIGTYDADTNTVKNPYYDRITTVNLASEPKTARKENLKRTDNYYLTFKGQFLNERKTALYIHESEISVEALGETVALDTKDEKTFIYGYKITFRNGATADFLKYEHLNVPGDFKPPHGWDRWENGEMYKVIDADTQRRRKEIAEAAGREYKPANVLKKYIVSEAITENYYIADYIHRTEKSENRTRCEELAKAFNKVIGADKFCYWHIEKLLKEYKIEKI